MGFDGTAVTPHIKTLIEKHHLGSILLTAKNLKCMRQCLMWVLLNTKSLTFPSCRRDHQAVL